jgi:CRP/FNR family transcriptional regulator, dissimilatory nitrate respiration regulator
VFALSALPLPVLHSSPYSAAISGEAGIFAGFTEQEKAELLSMLGIGIHKYEKGAILTLTDQVVNDVCVLLAGRLNILKADLNGNLQLLREVSPYETYTAEIVCTPTRVSPLIITCKTNAAILSLPYDRIVIGGTLTDAQRVRLMKNLLEIVANQNIRQLYKIDILSRRSLRERVCIYLSILQKKKSSSFSLSMNREELAQYLCVDRSALSRELGRMQRDGLIRFKKNQFQVMSLPH